MTRGLCLSRGRLWRLLCAALLLCGLGCASDTPDSAARGGGGDGGSSSHDASIEDAADGDGATDEQNAGQSGGGSGGSSGAAGAGGAGGAGAGGEGASSGAGGESGVGGESGQSGDPDASVEIDAGPQDAVCFSGGDEQDPAGTGACDAPIVIDMRELEYGDTVFHQSATETTNGVVPNIDKCAEGTGRDAVYNVQVPDAADLEVSVDARDGSDPIILVQDGPDTDCDKAAATLCIDDTEVGECEYVRIRVSQGGYDENTPQVVIAETEASGVALKVRFRLIDPGSGS